MARRPEEIAVILNKYGGGGRTQPEPQPEKSRAAQPQSTQSKSERGGLADGQKDLERAIWGDNPAPLGPDGGWAMENAADTINRTLGGGDIAQTIDSVLDKFGQRAEPNQEQDKDRSIEPSS